MLAHVGRVTECARSGVVNHHQCVWRHGDLIARESNHRCHACRYAVDVDVDAALVRLQRVVDRQAVEHRATRRVDVQIDRLALVVLQRVDELLSGDAPRADLVVDVDGEGLQHCADREPRFLSVTHRLLPLLGPHSLLAARRAGQPPSRAAARPPGDHGPGHA